MVEITWASPERSGKQTTLLLGKTFEIYHENPLPRNIFFN
jgi:hypothetical protein